MKGTNCHNCGDRDDQPRGQTDAMLFGRKNFRDGLSRNQLQHAVFALQYKMSRCIAGLLDSHTKANAWTVFISAGILDRGHPVTKVAGRYVIY